MELKTVLVKNIVLYIGETKFGHYAIANPVEETLPGGTVLNEWIRSVNTYNRATGEAPLQNDDNLTDTPTNGRGNSAILSFSKRCEVLGLPLLPGTYRVSAVLNLDMRGSKIYILAMDIHENVGITDEKLNDMVNEAVAMLKQ